MAPQGPVARPAMIVPTALPAVLFHPLAAIPPELEWCPHLPHQSTHWAYRQDIQDFMAFAGLCQPEQFWDVTWAQEMPRWDQLTKQEPASDIIGRKLAALSLVHADVQPPRSLVQSGAGS